MSERNGSIDSFQEFFGTTKKENEVPNNPTIAALIKTQPVVHQRRTSSESKAVKNSKKMPLTTIVKDSLDKSKHLESPLAPTVTSNYESDFDDETGIADKKTHNSLSPPKERTPESNRRMSDSKLRGSYVIRNPKSRPKQRILPRIRPKNHTKRLKKDVIGDAQQRVLSAQNQKLNELQSNMNELRRQLESERFENQTLRLIQKREEKVLRKYEDQEYDVHKVARNYTLDIANVKEKIAKERENQMKLEEEIESRNGQLHDQTKRIRFYHKLVEQEPELDQSDELREQLKEAERKLKKYEDKIAHNEKEIENREKVYRQKIRQELLKLRDLKNELQDHSKKYMDLEHRLEDKSRQVGTMHIYIQRGGRRPSDSSINLTKARSLQSLEDTSPRFREKALEYDKKRREEEKLKPKPKPRPIEAPSPPKPQRKKYIPSIMPKPKLKPKPTKQLMLPAYLEGPPVIEEVYFPTVLPPVRSTVHRLPTPSTINEDKNETDDKSIIETIRPKSKSLSPIPTKMLERSESPRPEPIVQKQVHTPSSSSSSEPPVSMSGIPTTASLFKPIEPKRAISRPLDDQWVDIFETNKKEDSAKDDLFSKLLSDESTTRQPVTTILKPMASSSKGPSMITFESASVLSNGNQKKPSRITNTSIYDFDQAVINLHEGKPVTTQPTSTKSSIDPFDALFDNNITKSISHLNNRDDTFTTTTQDQPDPFDSIFTNSASASKIAAPTKQPIRVNITQNDKLQRPKIVNNAPRPVPNRTTVEEIEEIAL